MADLKDQLTWCAASKQHLETLSHGIAHAENMVDAVIGMLRQCSFSELNAPLLPLHSQLQAGVKETQSFIGDKHIRYLEGRVKFIAGMLK